MYRRWGCTWLCSWSNMKVLVESAVWELISLVCRVEVLVALLSFQQIAWDVVTHRHYSSYLPVLWDILFYWNLLKYQYYWKKFIWNSPLNLMEDYWTIFSKFISVAIWAVNKDPFPCQMYSSHVYFSVNRKKSRSPSELEGARVTNGVPPFVLAQEWLGTQCRAGELVRPVLKEMLRFKKAYVGQYIAYFSCNTVLRKC